MSALDAFRRKCRALHPCTDSMRERQPHAVPFINIGTELPCGALVAGIQTTCCRRFTRYLSQHGKHPTSGAPVTGAICGTLLNVWRVRQMREPFNCWTLLDTR